MRALLGRRSAFTLLELLVVIAIIAVLSGLLLTGITRAKESVRKTVCRNNLHQIGVASLLYSDDNNGRLPAFLRWLYTTKYDLKTGRLFPYLKTKAIYMCPTDKLNLSRRRVGPVNQPKREYSYAMNCNICHTTALSGFRDPTRTVIYLEAELGPTDFSGQIGPMPGSTALSLRHGRKGHLMTGDLSVQSMSRKEFDAAARYRFFWQPNEENPMSGPRGPL